MLNIDNKHNITLNVGDNAVIDFRLCADELKTGDTVIFRTEEQTQTVTEFTEGVAKIQIDSKENPIDSCYYIRVITQDGREETVINGLYKRMVACQNG